MLTFDTILKELKNVPVNRLEEVYSFIHSLKASPKNTDSYRKKFFRLPVLSVT